MMLNAVKFLHRIESSCKNKYVNQKINLLDIFFCIVLKFVLNKVLQSNFIHHRKIVIILKIN